jgi:hypothetical protein
MDLAHDRESSTNKGTSLIKMLNFTEHPDNEIEGTSLKLGSSFGESSNQVKIYIASTKELENSRNFIFLHKTGANVDDSSSFFFKKCTKLIRAFD